MGKKRNRWRKLLIMSSMSVLFCVLGGYLVLNWVSDYALRSMLHIPEIASDHKQLDMEDQSVLFAGKDLNTSANQTEEGDDALSAGGQSGVQVENGEITANQETTTQDASVKAEEKKQLAEGNDESEAQPQHNKTNSKEQAEELDPSSPSNEADASSDKSAKEDTNKLAYSAHISPEKVDAVTDSITIGEKAKVVSTLAKRLKAEDIEMMKNLMQGGMDTADKKQAKEVVMERLSADEYNSLIKIAAKYGLSQGKSYEENLKE